MGATGIVNSVIFAIIGLLVLFLIRRGMTTKRQPEKGHTVEDVIELWTKWGDAQGGEAAEDAQHVREALESPVTRKAVRKKAREITKMKTPHAPNVCLDILCGAAARAELADAERNWTD